MSTTLLTRLDPRYPLLWRDERTLQFGIEGVATVDLGADWVEPLLMCLRDGIRRSTFDVVAHGCGAPRDEARALLASLQPLLVDDAPPTPPAWVDAVNLSTGREIERMRESLHDEGIPVGQAGGDDSIAVVLVGGAAAALQLAPYLRDDVPHLPVAFERDAAVVGPLVIPGRTPCLSCRDAHEMARDPAWPLLHAQLVGRATSVTASRIAQAAAMVARILRAPSNDAGLMVRIRPDGRHVWRSVRHHAECPCLGQSCRSPQGTETEPAPLVLRTATTSQREFAQPA